MFASLFNITVVSEWTAFTISFVLFSKKTGVWKLFTPFLFFTIIEETIGWYLHYILEKQDNSWIFNINTITDCAFIIWIFSYAEPLKIFKRRLRALTISFIGFGLINMWFIEGFWNYNGITEIIGDLLLATVSCLFFLRVLQEEEYRDLFRYEYFWLANGVLFTAMVSAVLYIFPDYLSSFYIETKINIYGYINYTLNVLLYGSLIVSFICRKLNTR